MACKCTILGKGVFPIRILCQECSKKEQEKRRLFEARKKLFEAKKKAEIERKG